MKQTKLALCLAAVITLQGCAAAAVATVVGGAAIITDKRDIKSQVDDQKIEIAAQGLIDGDDALDNQTNLSVISVNGSVLIVGQAPNNMLRDKAVKLVTGVKDVRQIHDQVRISNTTRFTTASNDAWLTTKVKSSLFNSEHVDPTNVKVVTENGEVFLMGLVTQQEADEAVDITRHISGVHRVYKLFEITP